MLLCLSLFGQTTASLTGTVTSVEGKRLAGVVVTIHSGALQGIRSTVTGESGTYDFASLPPGDYNAVFELAPYTNAYGSSTLRLAQVTRLDVRMWALRVTEELLIHAAPPSVLETPEVSTSLTLKQIE